LYDYELKEYLHAVGKLGDSKWTRYFTKKNG
jgi:hypothetical protein